MWKRCHEFEVKAVAEWYKAVVRLWKVIGLLCRSHLKRMNAGVIVVVGICRICRIWFCWEAKTYTSGNLSGESKKTQKTVQTLSEMGLRSILVACSSNAIRLYLIWPLNRVLVCHVHDYYTWNAHSKETLMLSKVCNWTGHFCYACEAHWRNLVFTRASQTMITDLQTAQTHRIYHSKLWSVWLSMHLHYHVWACKTQQHYNWGMDEHEVHMNSCSSPRLLTTTKGVDLKNWYPAGKGDSGETHSPSSSTRLATRTAILGVQRYIASLKSSISSLKLIPLLSTSRSWQEEVFTQPGSTWKACTNFKVETTYTQSLQWGYQLADYRIGFLTRRESNSDAESPIQSSLYKYHHVCCWFGKTVFPVVWTFSVL